MSLPGDIPRPAPGDWTAELSRILGLDEDLHAGRHFVRNEHRERVGSIWIEAAWWGVIRPSFHPPWAMCGVRARGEPFRGSMTPSWTKAAFVTTGGSAVVEISEDPVAKSLPSIDLSTVDDTMTLDGIGYEIHFRSLALEGSLTFSNPNIPALKKIERGLFSIGTEISTRSGVTQIAQVLDVWRGYLGKRLA